MTPVHDFTEKVSEIFPRNSVVGLQVVEQHVRADDQVAGVERVNLVPALKTKQRLSEMEKFSVITCQNVKTLKKLFF